MSDEATSPILNELPGVLNILRLQTGDRLVLHSSQELSDRQRDDIRSVLVDWAPEVKWLVLDNRMKLHLLRASDELKRGATDGTATG